MAGKTFSTQITIKETNLDTFGHVNNAMYLTLLEQARWDLITGNSYGLKEIKERGFGPVILEVKLQYLKELKNRDVITITTQCLDYSGKVGLLEQKMLLGDAVAAQAQYKFGLFDTKARKLVDPSPEWLAAIGWQ